MDKTISIAEVFRAAVMFSTRLWAQAERGSTGEYGFSLQKQRLGIDLIFLNVLWVVKFFKQIKHNCFLTAAVCTVLLVLYRYEHFQRVIYF